MLCFRNTFQEIQYLLLNGKLMQLKYLMQQISFSFWGRGFAPRP